VRSNVRWADAVGRVGGTGKLSIRFPETVERFDPVRLALAF
jgi:hypothetical protein